MGIVFILSGFSSFGSADIKFLQEKTNTTIKEDQMHCQACENTDTSASNSAIYFFNEDVHATVAEIQNAITNIGASWTAGLNSVTGSDSNENTIGLGCIIETSENTYENQPAPLAYNESLPDYYSWQNIEGIDWVTPARDQRSCGSCVAFGTISALEAVVQIELGQILDLDLSESHLFYCGGGSCSNGWTMSKSVKYLETYGVPEESCFPYTPTQTDCTETCPDWQTNAITIIDGARIKSSPPKIADVQAALIEHGPLVTTFNVYDDFFYYTSGIYEHVSGEVAGGHAVAIVGYDNINECWICKNSWGRNWGENVFFRIKYGNSGIGSVFNTYYFSGVSGGICEKYLPSKLENPNPAPNAVNVVTDLTLTWDGGDPNPEDTVYYELYFGNTSNNLLFMSRLGPFPSSQKGISYDLDSLNVESNYFWQVIAIDSEQRKRIGPIWHFSTIDVVAPHLEILTPIAGFFYTDNGNTRKQIPSERAVIYGPINVKLYVFDNGSGLQQVDIFVDNKLKASLTTQPFEWYWNTFSIGKHTLTIKAIDYSGNLKEKKVDVQTYILRSKSVTTT